MATPAQAAAATVGAGSLAAAGAYGITQAVNGSGEETTTEEKQETNNENIEMPNEVSVFANTDVSAEPYSGKLISLIKAANLPNLVKPDDQKWWDWAFKNKYQKFSKGKQFHQLFQSVTNSETLKTACDSAYKAEKTDYSFETNHHLLQNISDYCTKTEESIDISEPKFVVYTDKPEGYDNGLLSVESNRSQLVKSKIKTEEEQTNHNDLWWNWAFKNVFSKATEAKTSDFEGVNKGYSGSDNSGSDKFLNNACDAAYKKVYADLKTTNSKPNLLDDIKRFCSVNPKTTELVLPEPASPTVLSTSSSGYTENKLVKANPSKLVDPSNNQDWWNWMFTVNFSKLGNGKSSLPDPFKNVNSGHSGTAVSGNNQTALNQACKEAYTKDQNTLGNPTPETTLLGTVKKYCTPSTVTDNLSVPEA